MSKIIVFVEGAKVTGYEVIDGNMLEAARRGLSGADATAYDRAVKQLGADVMAAATKSAVLKTEDEALAEIATSRGKAFILVDRLPTVRLANGKDDVDFDQLVVDGGKVVLKAAA